MRLALAFGLLLSCFCVVGQTTQADFTIPSPVCLAERIKIENLSTNASQYFWDFCGGDLGQQPTANVVTNNFGGYGTRVEVAESAGQFFGFFLSGGTKALFKLSFGSNVNNTPVITNLGDLGLNSNQLRSIDIVQDNGLYFGFVVDSDKNKLYRIDFGSSLNNPPSNAVEIFSGTPLNTPYQISSVSDGALKYLFITNQGDGKLIRLKFTSTYSDPISESFSISITTNWLNGVSFIKASGRWYCITGSPLLTVIQKVDFVNGLGDNSPVVTTIAVPSNPMGLELVNENGNYYAFVQTRNATLSIFRLDFGASMASVPSITDVNNFGYGSSEIWNYSMFNDKSSWVAFGTESIGPNIFRLKFPSNCFSEVEYSTDEEPEIYSANSGTYKVSLTTQDLSGNNSYKSQSLTVSATVAPEIDFSQSNVCVSSAIEFTSESPQVITSFNWSFGDMGTSTDPNPSHQYTAAGDYTVSLQVTAANSCNNFVERIVSIFEEPAADFIIPIASPYCSNQNYFFENTSTTDSGYPVSWQWNVNGVDVSTDEDLTFAFASTTNQDISLTASIPGCENEVIKNIATLQEGPTVNFNSVGTCEDELVIFTNSSSGSITNYVWDFGDGQQSTDVNPSHQFSDIGIYDVTLTAYSGNGCNNLLIKTSTIYTKPNVDFGQAPPPFSCNGTPTVFYDETELPTDSNLDSWLWNFGDPGSGQNSSTEQNPQHTYALAGNYDVTLTITTDFNCSTTLQLPIVISQTPAATIALTSPCEDVAINFSGTSVDNIASWSWLIGSTPYTSQNPVHTFVNSGTFLSQLRVTSQNGCEGIVDSVIEVPQKLNANFEFTKNCINQQSLFTDITNDGADPISEYLWEVPGSSSVSGSPATFTFPTTGMRNVKLTVTTETGCNYTVTKPVSIVASPIASFTANPDAGGPPLLVNFTNTSTNATSYRWIFNDGSGSESTEVSPSFTYQTLGEYLAELTASNALGCVHTVGKTISVVNAVLDIEVNGLELIEFQNGSLKPAVTIFNHGNTPVSNLPVLLNMSGPVIREYVSAIIQQNNSYRHVFQFEFPSSSGLDYFCVQAEVEDITPNDNTVCLNVDKSFTTIEPYPNPNNTGTLNVKWILDNEGLVNITLINSMGQSIQHVEVKAFEGLGAIDLSTIGMGAGVYFLQVSHKQNSKVFRVFISE